MAESGCGNWGNLVVLSNRGPMLLREEDGRLSWKAAVSGLVSAVEPVLMQAGGTWVAWGGRTGKGLGACLEVPGRGKGYVLQELLLDGEEVNLFYNGLCNGVLWPLCHCFLERCSFQENSWQVYQTVNERFAEQALACGTEESSYWIQDYHLALVPQLVRNKAREAVISIFWHIPFPPYDVFRIFPWATELLEGMLGSDLIAFHLPDYAANFLRCCQKLLGMRVEGGGRLRVGNRWVAVRALPIGVDWPDFQQLASRPGIQARAQAIRQAAGSHYLLLGVDRLDYTKGILERLRGLELLLERHPSYRRQITLLQVAAPTRQEEPAYREMKRRVDEAVGRINGQFGENWRSPVRYLYRSLSREELVAHYLAADVMLVTPLRDGLNLVAKEYVASRTDCRGGLLLSPFAGAAAQLKGAILANPYQPEDLAGKLEEALEMDPSQQEKRMTSLRREVRQHDLAWWQGAVARGIKETVGARQSHQALEAEIFAYPW